MLTGRNHHSVGMGSITELATSPPGNNSLRPNAKAPLAETLKLNGYSTAQFMLEHIDKFATLTRSTTTPWAGRRQWTVRASGPSK